MRENGGIELDILFLQFFEAIRADTLITEERNVIRIAAENAGGLIFL
jgi:hypothetical protein